MYLLYSKYEKALQEYKKAQLLSPSNLEIPIKLSKIYSKMGLISRACEELKKLKRENPQFLDAGIQLGVHYYGHGQIIEAQREWQAVLAKGPGHKEAMAYLEMAENAKETKIES